MKLVNFLTVLALGWIPAAHSDERPVPDYSEYVYLHVTRGEAVARVNSCRGKVQTVRS